MSIVKNKKSRIGNRETVRTARAKGAAKVRTARASRAAGKGNTRQVGRPRGADVTDLAQRWKPFPDSTLGTITVRIIGNN